MSWFYWNFLLADILWNLLRACSINYPGNIGADEHFIKLYREDSRILLFLFKWSCQILAVHISCALICTHSILQYPIVQEAGEEQSKQTNKQKTRTKVHFTPTLWSSVGLWNSCQWRCFSSSTISLKWKSKILLYVFQWSIGFQYTKDPEV